MKRKGFTLVELLIVIVVIGVLSAMMMLSSTEAVSSAKANNIISNLRNLKTAALAWYVDSMDLLKNVDVGTVTNNSYKSSKHDDCWKYVKKYLSSGSSSELDSNYTLVYNSVNANNNDKNIWFVMYGDENLSMAIKEKLKARAASVGLLTKAAPTSEFYGSETFNKNVGNWVFMRVK